MTRKNNVVVFTQHKLVDRCLDALVNTCKKFISALINSLLKLLTFVNEIIVDRFNLLLNLALFSITGTGALVLT